MKNTIDNISKLLMAKEIKSQELTEEYIKKIEKLNPLLNAYVCKSFEKAREYALNADDMIQSGKGSLLTGIPMALKANICTDGIQTDCCSKMLKGYIPNYDATAWKKLSENGAIILGKTNMDEFAMGSTSETSCYGAPKNPLNTSYVTGGSSGGSAAVVAADMAVYALGSDTGGSVRQPASYCGVVGFKPSYGMVSRNGLIAYASSFDQIGIISKTVQDAAYIFDVIKGNDVYDQTCDVGNIEKSAHQLSEDIRGTRIGLIRELFEVAEEEVKKVIANAADTYSEMGAIVEEISIPEIKDCLSAYYIIACAEASSNLGRYDGIRFGHKAENYKNTEDMMIKSRSEGFGAEVKKRIMLGTYVLSEGFYDAYYKKACLVRERIKTAFSEVFCRYDILLAPTTPTTAPKAGSSLEDEISMYRSDLTTVPANVAGLPAISVNCGFDGKKLPIGMQLIGKRYDDAFVLKAAYAFERTY